MFEFYKEALINLNKLSPKFTYTYLTQNMVKFSASDFIQI
jgi:hypothetical protein